MTIKTITVHFCDGCGSEKSKDHLRAVSLWVDERSCAAGGFADQIHAAPDLCIRCLHNLVNRLLTTVTKTDQAKIAKNLYPNAIKE